MRASEHPNNAPGVPMIFPPAVRELSGQVHEPDGQADRRGFMPGMATIKHRGRKSGKPYETIVTAYRKGDTVAIALGHGKTDWVKNVLAAGEADLHLIRRDLHLTNPRILPAGSGGADEPAVHGPRAGEEGRHLRRRYRLTR